MPIVFKVAESSEDKETVFKLRHRVFVEQEQRFAHQTPYIVDMFDAFTETFNILAIKENEPIGTIRVVMNNPVGMPANEHFNFSSHLESLKGKIACIGWLCTLKEYRSYPGLLLGLFKMAVHEMRKDRARFIIATLHPPLMRLLQRSFNAKRVGEDFKAPGLEVFMTPTLIDIDGFPPRSREAFDDGLDLILEDSNVRKIYQEDEVITEKGEIGDDAFLILRGSVRILPTGPDGTSIFPEPGNYSRMGGGDLLFSRGSLLGELSLLDTGVRTSTIIPYSKEVDLLVWSKEVFMNQLKMDKERAIDICRLLGERLRCQIQKETEVSTPQIQNIARVLYDASIEGQKPVNATWLSRQCGFWPESLHEMTKTWQENNIISIDKDIIRVLAPQSLCYDTSHTG